MAPGGEGVGVVGTQLVMRGAGHVLHVVQGGRDLAGLTEAQAGADEGGVGIGPVEGVLGVEGERLGAGSQGLGEGGVAFDFGPGRDQGIGGGSGEPVVLTCGEAVADGTLEELVDADGVVRAVGGVVDQAEAVQRTVPVSRPAP